MAVCLVLRKVIVAVLVVVEVVALSLVLHHDKTFSCDQRRCFCNLCCICKDEAI
jgi:hypothetical protein